MHYVGIDMAKDTFHAAFDEATILIFNNTTRGITKFMKRLAPESAIGVEATGAYHLLFARVCTEAGFVVHIINPLLTYRAAQSSSLRKVKTDRHDALTIRNVLITGAGYPFVETADLLALKAVMQEREALVRVQAETKQRIQIHKVKEQAIGFKLHNPYTHIMKVCATQIAVLTKQMGAFEPHTQNLLRSIPGIGPVAAASLVAYIQDINRFENPKKLTAYVGLDCRVHQSGTSINGKGFITKRGNVYLRSILFNAAFVSRQHIPELQQFFHKKLSEGKHYFTASVAVERKLLHVIYSVWKRGTPYERKLST